MAFNVNGTLIELSGTGLKTTYNSKIGVNNNSGIITFPNRPYFVAYSTAAGTYYTANAWQTITLNSTFINNGSNYSTSTGRFTAPVTGSYYCEYSSYGSKTTSTNSDSYTHAIFLINGSTTTRKASNTTDLRLRSRTYYSSSYSWDQQINDIFYLTAGDYVQPYVYCNGTQYWVPAYTHFTGFLIG